MYKILNKINSPKDLKKLSFEELKELANEIRLACLNRTSEIGGHIGSNLCVAELTIAIHYVFDFLKDKLVLDVSHQCYPHKILTGRKSGFIEPDKMKDISGYLAPNESEYDLFHIGHTSTSISLASGIAKARDLNKQKFNVVAMIGDGSLSGGEAFEGLNNAGATNSNFIVIINDNDMSIAENQGALARNLRKLKNSKGKSENNFFKSLGFDYLYIEDGNNVEILINELSKIKNISHPIVVHVNTVKGNGYNFAMNEKEKWHFRQPFNIETGELKTATPTYDYYKLTHDYLLNEHKKNKDLVVVTAATPGLCGFTQDLRDTFAERFVDVTIAEEHAVAYVSALAKSGKRPVFGVYSSFIQRAYDQLSQELSLNNSPAVILVFKGGISAANATHLGVFDIALTKSIPNLVCMSPATPNEYVSMLNWAINQTSHPVMIRVPFNSIDNPVDLDLKEEKSYYPAKFETVKSGEKVCILALGKFFKLGEQVCTYLEENHGFNATLINPIYSNILDKDMLDSLSIDHTVFVTLEDGVVAGGFGESVSSYLSKYGKVVLNFGAEKEFTSNVSVATLKEKYGLNPEFIANEIMKKL